MKPSAGTRDWGEKMMNCSQCLCALSSGCCCHYESLALNTATAGGHDSSLHSGVYPLTTVCTEKLQNLSVPGKQNHFYVQYKWTELLLKENFYLCKNTSELHSLFCISWINSVFTKCKDWYETTIFKNI